MQPGCEAAKRARILSKRSTPEAKPVEQKGLTDPTGKQARASPYSAEYEAWLRQDPANTIAVASLHANIETVSGYTFTDPSYFTAAFTRLPQTVGSITYRKLRYQLALIGDTLLQTQYYTDVFPIADDEISKSAALRPADTWRPNLLITTYRKHHKVRKARTQDLTLVRQSSQGASHPP